MPFGTVKSNPEKRKPIKKEEEEEKDPDEIMKEMSDSAFLPKSDIEVTPNPTIKQCFELKILAEQVCRKYIGTKKRWLDPKHQQEADYLLCMKLLELCK